MNNIKMKLKKKNEEAFKKLMDKQGWKNCPGCNVIIERSFGCFHMKCTHCKTEFCNQCGIKLDPTKWAEHFNIGKCVLWNNEKDLLDN